MKSFTRLLLVVGILNFSGAAFVLADEMKMPVAKEVSAEFARIKSLAGKWEGSTTTEGKTEPVTIEYKVTSGGNVVLETLMPGTPHEMISVYQDDAGGKLKMTHYCMLPNTPVLNLKSSDNKSIVLDLAADSGIAADERHMHGLTLTQSDADHLTQSWTCYESGSSAHSTIMEAHRVS